MFGSLNAPGVSAAAQIEDLGSAGDTTPPDTTGAIGPNDYVEFVNDEIVAYARADLAQVGAPSAMTSFVGDKNVEGSACDPQIKYDPQTSRWFYAAIECNGTTTENTLYLGFSKTSDPTDLSTAPGHGWCGYEYSFGTVFEDYPKLGLDSQHIIIGANSFKPTSPFTFLTAHIFSLPKPAAGEIGACPAAPALTAFGSEAEPLRTTVASHEASTPEPATVADGSPDGYVVASDEASPFSGEGEHIMIWQVAGTGVEPKLIALGAPAVAAFELPPSIPQPASTDEIDSLDGRLTQAVAARDPSASGAEAVWTQHTVGGGAGSVVRWYELIPSTLTVRQAGTISDPGGFVFNGAIAPTLGGGAVIDYNTGGDGGLVQIMAQSRVATAPPGTMNTPILLSSSSAVDTDFSCPSQPLGEAFEAESCRWGDYAGASVDPANGEVVWGSSQVNGPIGPETAGGHEAQWATRNFALEANDVAPTASFGVAGAPGLVGAPVGFDASASSDVDGPIVSYDWSFGDGAAGSGVDPSHTYGAAGNYTVGLTVTDVGAKTGTVTRSLTIDSTQGPASSTATATVGTSPNSSLGSPRVTINRRTGALTVTTVVANPGLLVWASTFKNGKFGAFRSSARCKKGRIRLGGRCLPAKIVFAKGRRTIEAAGAVSVTLKPSASALTALRSARKHSKGVRVSIVLTFRSSLGGPPGSRTRTVIVKLKR